jgi:hypothetical protein
VAYHRQKLRRIKYDEISSLFYDKKVCEYMLNIFKVSPKNESDRRMVEKGEVPGISDDLRRHAELRTDILSFSDQYDLNELVCLDYVVAVFRNPGLVRELEKSDSSKYTNYYDLNDHKKVIEAAMDLYVYERQAVLKSLLLLLKLSYMSEDSASSEKELDTVANVLASEYDHDGDNGRGRRDEDVILAMAEHLIVKNNLSSHLIGTAASLYSKAKRRHGISDDYHSQHDTAGDSQGFSGAGLKSLLQGSGSGSAAGAAAAGFGAGSSLSSGSSSSNGGSNYLTPRGTILHQFAELHSIGEAIFYCFAVFVPPIEQVGKIQILTSCVSIELMKEDHGTYGDGGDYSGAGDDSDDSNGEFSQIYRACLHSFLISLQMTHMQSIKLLANSPREASLDSILGLIPSEYRKNMQEMIAPPLRWGEGMLLFSFVHVLASRGGFNDEGDFDSSGGGRASGVGVMGSMDSSNGDESKYALIFKGILAWVQLSRAFSFLRLGVLPVLQSSCKSSISASTGVGEGCGDSGGGLDSSRGPYGQAAGRGIGGSIDNTQISFNIIPDARYVNNTAGDLFMVLVSAVEVTADVFSSEELTEFHSSWYDISNLYAAVFAVYPPLGAKFILNEDNTSFRQAVTSCLRYTMEDSKAIIPALYLLAGLASGAEDALETVYRFLDKASPSAASASASGSHAWGEGTRGSSSSSPSAESIPNMSLHHFMMSLSECARICSGGATNENSDAAGGAGSSSGSVLKDNHEKVLIAILSLVQALCRSPGVCDLFLRDYRPLEVLFRLVCGPVSVSLKGCVFRTLAVIASSTAGATGPVTSSSSMYGGGGMAGGGDTSGASSTHDELWHLIESHRLLPSPYEGPNGGGAQSGGGVAGMTNASMGMGSVGQSGVYTGNDMSGGKGAGGGMYTASSSAGGRPRPSRGGGSGGGGGGRYGSGQHADDDEGVSLSYLQGLRLELEDSESKLGVYAITDSFLLLLEALLVGSARSQSRSNGRPHHDVLGAGIRTPGILHYLEYLVCDVLLTTQDRFFINGAHGEGQRWRLLSRSFRVLSAALASYPVHLMPALRAKVDAARKSSNNGGSDSTGNRSALVAIGANGLTPEEESLLVYLSADFDGLKTMASIAGSSSTTSNNASAKRGVPTGPASAGLYVMTLLLAWDSPVRSLLLEVLRLGASESFEISRKNNIYASAVQASKMGAVLGYGRHLDTRLSYSSTQGQGDVDGFHWRGKCVSAATELLYELSVREKAFYHGVTAAVGAPKVALMRVGDRGNSYYQSTVTIKPLSEILLAHRHAMGSLVATASMTGLVVQEMAMYSRRDVGYSSVAANISLYHPSSSSSSSNNIFAGNALSSTGGVSSMAALVLVKALGECSIVAGEEFLEKILTHPGNDPASSSSKGENNSGYGGSKLTASEGREWSLRSLQACLLDTLRASLVDPSSHPRSCEPLCSQVVALGDDPCPFHETEDDDDEDENDNDEERRPGSGNSGAGSKGKASVAAAAAAAPRAKASEHASGVVLQTLLSMLRGDKLALSHVLLGLVPALDPTYSNRWDLQLGASFSSTSGWVPASRHSQAMAVPQTVLGQILLLVEDSADIIQSQPHLASLCYQLLYTLCRHKITSSVVLAFLRAYSVNSSGRRMKFIPFVIKQVVGSLRAHSLYASGYDDNKNSNEEGESGGGDVDRDSASASASALCGAWALKILSLEYRAIDSLARSERSILTSDLQELLSLYLDVNTTATYSGGVDYAGSGDEEEEDEDDEDREFIGFSELLAAAVSASRVSTHGLTLTASVSVRVDGDLGDGGAAGSSSSSECSSESPFSLGNALGSSGGRNNRSSTSLVSVSASDILSYPAVAACITQATVTYSVEAGVVKHTSGSSSGSTPYGSRSSSAANGNAAVNGGSGISSSRGSQSDREVATGDWGSGRAGKDRHRSGGGTSGPHCFSIVDKAMFSTAFWASMGDNSGNRDNRRGSGGSSASIDDWPLEVQYSLALQAITLLNRHRRDLASSVYLLGAWEQCVSVMVALLGRHLTRAATSAPLGSNSNYVGPPFSYQHSGGGGAQPSGSALLYDREANLRHYLRYLLRPTLSALDGSVDVLDSAVLEHLSSAVYTLVSGERLLSSSQYFPPVASNINSSSSLGKRKISDDQQQQQSTAGGVDAPRDLGKDGCAPASVRLPLSVLRRLVSVSLSLSAAPIRPLQAAMRLRGLAFASVGCYLEPYLSMTPPYSVSKSAASSSNQSAFHVYDEDLGASGNGATAAITAHLAANMSALTDALSREACEGPLVWRLSALSCLCRILSLVDSEALAGAARAVEANGLLSQLLPLAGVNPDAALSVRNKEGSSSNNSSRTVSDGDGAEIRYATLSLCILLASVPEGHAAVTRGCGDDLCYLNLSALLASYGLPSAPAQAPTAGLRGRRGELLTDQSASQRWLLGVLPVLKLVQALALSSPSTIRAQTGCAQVVCQNTRAISHIVSAPWPALRKLLPRRSSDSYFDSSSASGTSSGDSSSYLYLNGSAATTATALKVASTQQQACATVASLLKIVSSSLTFHSLGKELALRGQAAAASSASDSVSRSGSRSGDASSAASRVRQEEGTELLASSRRQVHALVGSLIASNNGSGDDDMGNTTGFDDVSVAAPSLSTVTDLFATLARCLDSAMVSGEMNGAYGSAHDDAHTEAFSRGGGDYGDYASEHGLSSMPQGLGGVANASLAETVASHGWSTHHHTALQHVLSTLESVSVVVRNMTTAHATHARLATVAMGTIAASSAAAAASLAADAGNVAGVRTRSSKSGGGGGGFFGMDLLSQFGGGASLSSLPEVLIKGHSSRAAAAAGSGVPGFASGSSSGDASSSNDDLQLRIARLGQAVNDEFANLKFPLSRVLTLFLVLSSFDQLHAPYAHTIAARANAESGSSSSNGGSGGLLLLSCLEGYAASVHHALENLIMVIYSEVLSVSTHACAVLPNEHNTGYHYCDANGEVILTAQTVSLLSRVMHHARSSFKLRAIVDHQYRHAGDFDHHMHHAVTSSSSSSFGGHGSSNAGQGAEQRSLQVVSEIDILLSGLDKLRN